MLPHGGVKEIGMPAEGLAQEHCVRLNLQLGGEHDPRRLGNTPYQDEESAGLVDLRSRDNLVN